MSGTVKINHERAERHAAETKQVAESIADVRKQLRDKVAEDLGPVFGVESGSAAETAVGSRALVNRIGKELEQLDKAVEQLEEIAEAMKKTSDAYLQAASGGNYTPSNFTPVWGDQS